MRTLIQRVSEASVTIDNKSVSKIKHGLLILVCAMATDTEMHAEKMALKIAKIRIFNDTNMKMNKSILDINGEALIVSQFTLAADTTRGNRPGFSTAATSSQGEKLYEHFISSLKNHSIPCKKGVFGEFMSIQLVNDGPTTVWIDNS